MNPDPPRPYATRTEIAAISSLDDRTLDTVLGRLTERQALVRTEPSDEAVYELATRDWSAAPDKPAKSQ